MGSLFSPLVDRHDIHPRGTSKGEGRPRFRVQAVPTERPAVRNRPERGASHDGVANKVRVSRHEGKG